MDKILNKKMPVLFIAHGSPMNALAMNSYTKSLNKLEQEIQKPKAILCVSAHWQTRGTKIVGVENPQVIYDFGGFPEELYQVQYPAKGSSLFAQKTKNLIRNSEVVSNWGLDHGAWSVLKHLYPLADVPVYQVSIDVSLNEEAHFQVGKRLQSLREEGVLILGSGNIVHNLRLINWKSEGSGEAYDWCLRFDQEIKKSLSENKRDNVLKYKFIYGKDAELSVPTDEHYLPLIYCLGASQMTDKVSFPYEGYEMGSLSMTSVMWSE